MNLEEGLKDNESEKNLSNVKLNHPVNDEEKNMLDQSLQGLFDDLTERNEKLSQHNEYSSIGQLVLA